MDTPSNKEVSFSNKRLRIRLQHPSSGTGKDEVRVNLASLACQKGKNELVEKADHSPRYTCEVCENTFPSLNSLHGHTRVHPKDEKKKVVIDSSSKDEDEEVKARKRKNYEDPRSKDAVRHSDTIMFVDTQEEVRNGARDLYFLKYRKDWDTPYVSTSIKRSKSKDNVASSSNSQLVMGYDIGIGIYYSNKQRELIKEMQAAQIPTENESRKEKEKCMAIIPYVGNSSTQIPIASPQIPIETVRSLEIVTYAGKTSTQSPTENERFDVNEGKKKIMTEISSNAEGVVLHVCRICHMSFIKPQALGGHMTLHRTNEQKIQGDEIVNKKNGHKEEHECEKCGRKFPTGQKLGGHKRAHYDKEKLKKRKCTDMISECSPVNSKEDGQVVVKNVGVPGTEEVHGGVEKVKGLGDELSMVNSKEEGQVVAGYVGDHGTEEANGGVKHGFDLNLEPMEQHGEN